MNKKTVTFIKYQKEFKANFISNIDLQNAL